MNRHKNGRHLAYRAASGAVMVRTGQSMSESFLWEPDIVELGASFKREHLSVVRSGSEIARCGLPPSPPGRP
jgi:hypothetical protein